LLRSGDLHQPAKEKTMSHADISDNRYEVEASKPQLKSLSSIVQMGIMAFFVVGGLWIGLGVLKGIFLTPKGEVSSMEKQFSNPAAAKPAAAPTAAPAAAPAPAPAEAAPAAAPAGQ
jgi:hypothetical protein